MVVNMIFCLKDNIQKKKKILSLNPLFLEMFEKKIALLWYFREYNERIYNTHKKLREQK